MTSRIFALALFGAASIAFAQVPAVRWYSSTSPEAQYAVFTGRGEERVCRGGIDGTLYSGTLGGHGCVVRIGGGDTFVATYEVAVGFVKWDSPGAEGRPIVSGKLGQQDIEVCRGRVRSSWVVGSRLAGAAACEVPGTGSVAAPDFEVLFAARLGEPHQIVPVESGLCLGMTSGAQARSTNCRAMAPLQWVVLQDVSGYLRFFSPANTALCLTLPRESYAVLAACGPESAFRPRPISDTAYRLVTPSGLALTMENGSVSAGVPVIGRVADSTLVKQQSFEVLGMTDQSRKLRVLTYNMMLLSPYAFPGMKQVERAYWIALAIGREGTRPDVIAIQEAFAFVAYDVLKAALRGLGYPYLSKRPYDFLNAGKGLENGGVFIASRWPIESMEDFTYTLGTGADGAASKGASYALINKMGQRYHVFSTHLQADDQPAIRAVQLMELRNFVTSRVGTNPAGDPVIIAGDFNIDMEGGSEYGTMLAVLQANFHQAPRPVGASSGSALRWTVNPATNDIARKRGASVSWLDYVLVHRSTPPRQASYRVIEYEHSEPYEMGTKKVNMAADGWYRDLSDHSALVAGLRF